MSDDAKWVELEYSHLRAEIMALMDAKLSTVRFYLPAAASVYAIPYVLKQTNQSYLWTLCAVVAGLLILTMAQTQFASTSGIRRLSVYLKEVLEPRTSGGLKWEHAVSLYDQSRRFSLGQSFVISASAVVANIVAAVAAAEVFLVSDPYRLAPIVAALATAVLTVPALWLMFRPIEHRKTLVRRLSPLLSTATEVEQPTATDFSATAG